MIAATRNVKAIRPLLDRVLVSRFKSEAKTSSGIFIPEKSQEKLSEGTVLAAGSGGFDKDGKRIPMDVKVGDKVHSILLREDNGKVLLPAYGGNNLKIGEEEYTLYKSSEILAIINEGASS